MMLSRRRFLIGCSAGAAAVFLSACGGAATPTATTTRPSAAPSAAPSAVPSAASVASAAPAASPTVAATRAAATPAASGGPASPVASGPLKTVRVGYVPVLIYSPLFIAIDKGYFKEQGIEAVPTSLTGGTDILTQTAQGNFEVGLSGVGASALNAIKRGLDLRIVASQHAESPPMATPLVVAKKKYDDGTYKKVADLKGKNVSINAKGTATEYWLHSALAKNGLSIKDINLTALAFDQVAAALVGGSVDGAMLGEPLVTLAEQQGLVQRLADDFLTNAQGTVIFYNLKWGRESGIADRWLAAWLKGARDLRNGGYAKDENAAIIEKFTKVPKEVVKVAKPPIHDPNGALNLTDMKAQQEYFLTTGSLTYTDAIDLATVIDTSYVEKALALIGKI